MIKELLILTLATYISMIIYSAAVGWCLGSGVDVKFPDLTQEQRTFAATTSASFVILRAKWVLLLGPASFATLLLHREDPILFVYAYTSTMIVHLLIAKLIKMRKRNKG